MSHELALVIVDASLSEAEIENRVSALVRPHSNIDDEDKYPYRCDGWTIGGRYDGQIYGASPEYNLSPEEFQKRYGLDVVQLGPNVRSVNEISESFIKEIDSLVLPDGNWQSRFDKDFQNNITLWEKFVADSLKEYSSKWGVVVDAHS